MESTKIKVEEESSIIIKLPRSASQLTKLEEVDKVESPIA